MSFPRPSSPRFLPGTLLGARYRVERLLAEGAMGMVLQATDVLLGKSVAIKLRHAVRSRRADAGHLSSHPPGPPVLPEGDDRFVREARIAGQLAGEHLARVDGAGHTDAGDPFLVMELLSGRDLAAELAERGPLPVAEAVDAILEACAGVAEAHAAGLVHRDLKPANLFVARGASTEAAPGPSIKVLDFGLTRLQPEKGQVDLAATESNFDTPQYMAPEQVRSSPHVDARTDQHALGAVLHELLTGKPPFQAPDFTQLAVAIAVEPPPHARAARPEVPPALDAAIRRALAKRPDDRFPDLRAFAEAIAPFGGDRAQVALRAVQATSAPAAGSQPPVAFSSRAPAVTASRASRSHALRSPPLALVSMVAFGAAFGVYRLVAGPPAMPVLSAAPAGPGGLGGLPPARPVHDVGSPGKPGSAPIPPVALLPAPAAPAPPPAVSVPTPASCASCAPATLPAGRSPIQTTSDGR